MRVTIIAIGSRGDVQPYVALGAGLALAGHDVRLATHPAFAALVGGHGVELAAVAEGDLSRGRDTPAGSAWLDSGQRVLPDWVGMLKDAASVAQRRLHDCWVATDGADVIVTSVLGTLLALQLARERGIPLVRAYYAPLGPWSRRHVRQAVWLCSRPWVNRARRAALDLPPLGLAEPFGSLDRSGVPTLYGFSAAVLAPPADGEATGYWLVRTGPEWTPPRALAEFLAGGEPPVLVTFGALADRRPAETTALLLEALRRAERRAILIRGPYLLPDVDLGPAAIAVDDVPYDWLFPRLSAVVHHGGAGTTACALRAGVPSVTVPAFADQPLWASRIDALGVGPPPIPRRQLTAARLEKGIRTAAGDGRMRERAAALAARLAAEDGVGVAVERIERHQSQRRVVTIAGRSRPACPLCGTRGSDAHSGLRDRLTNVSGTWRLARCPAAGCGALWLDPQPVSGDIGHAYEDYYTHDPEPPPRVRPLLGVLAALRRMYLHDAFGYGAPRRGTAAVAAALRAVPGGRDAMLDTACHLPTPGPGARLLEVGFGSAEQLARMRELGWTVTGVDTDPIAVAAARARGLEVAEGELGAQGYAAGSFDAVYMSHVVEHVEDPPALLRECRRVLRPGGRLVAITPNVLSWGHRTFGPAWFGLDPPRHLVLFSPSALRATTALVGFSDVDVRTSARIAFVTWIAGRDIRREGRVVSFSGAVPLTRLARGIAAQVAESALLTVRPSVGEELVMTARS